MKTAIAVAAPSKDFIRIYRTRIARNGKPGIDITVKSAKDLARWFAPSWGMVMGHKGGTVSDDSYTMLYRVRLDHAPTAAWDWLAAEARKSNNTLTFRCFCADGQFCHTYLLASYMAERWPETYQDCTREGTK